MAERFAIILDDEWLQRLSDYAGALGLESIASVIALALTWAAATGLDAGDRVRSEHPFRLRQVRRRGVNRYTLYVPLSAEAMRWLTDQAFRHRATRQAAALAAIEAWAEQNELPQRG